MLTVWLTAPGRLQNTPCMHNPNRHASCAMSYPEFSKYLCLLRKSISLRPPPRPNLSSRPTTSSSIDSRLIATSISFLSTSVVSFKIMSHFDEACDLLSLQLYRSSYCTLNCYSKLTHINTVQVPLITNAMQWSVSSSFY